MTAWAQVLLPRLGTRCPFTGGSCWGKSRTGHRFGSMRCQWGGQQTRKGEARMKRTFVKLLLAGTLIGVTAGMANAVTLISNQLGQGSTLGYYNNSLGDLYFVDSSVFPGPNVSTGDPTRNPITAAPTNFGPNIGTWLTNAAPSGQNWSSSLVSIPKQWTINQENAIVYELNAGAFGLSNVHFDLGVDNGIFMWLDGIYLFGAMASGGSTLGEYKLNIPSISSGMHYVQILREDHGGSDNFDIVATGDFNRTAPVPEPGTMVLLGSGVLGLAGVARRKNRK